MADPVGLADPERVERLDEVGDVGRKCPRRIRPGAPVAAQVRRDDVEPLRPMLLGKPLETLPVPRDSVQADERGRARIAPLVHMEDHCDPSYSGLLCAPTSRRGGGTTDGENRSPSPCIGSRRARGCGRARHIGGHRAADAPCHSRSEARLNCRRRADRHRSGISAAFDQGLALAARRGRADNARAVGQRSGELPVPALHHARAVPRTVRAERGAGVVGFAMARVGGRSARSTCRAKRNAHRSPTCRSRTASAESSPRSPA
jgi:hypothetical protein